MRKRLIAVVAVTALFGSGLVAAAAASLGPLSGGIFSAAGPVTYEPAVRSASDLVLTSAGDPATVSALTVTITGVDLANLDGQDVTIALLDSGGVQQQLITATLVAGGNLAVGATTAAVSLPVTGAPPLSTFASWAVFIAGVQALGPLADPTARVVTVGSGNFTVVVTPVDWQTLLVPATAPFITTTITTTTATPYTVCISVAMVGTKANPELWSLDIDYSEAPFWGTKPTVDAHVGFVVENGTVMTLTGTDNGTGKYDEYANNKEIRNTITLTVTVCLDDPPMVDSADAYTVSPQSRGTWTDELACVRRTVTGNNSYPFYFGWAVALDLTDAYAKLQVTDAGAPRSLAPQPNVVSPAFDPVVKSYTVTNAVDTSIAGTEARVVELCAAR